MSDFIKDMYIEETKIISRRLARYLRHHPEEIGIELDGHGWADIDTLALKSMLAPYQIKACTGVCSDGKERFELSSDERRIRAIQGHSVQVDMDYKVATPPEALYHGTAQKSLELIFEKGIQRRSRLFVHLTEDKDLALKVGKRHGQPVVLQVQAREMHNAGYRFYYTDNGIWLTDEIPPEFVNQV